MPTSGSLTLRCRTTTAGAQLRLLVQRPGEYRDTNTLNSLQSSGDYDVHITDALLVSVTIKDVTQHNGTSYTCVQYFGRSTEYVSETFHLVLPREYGCQPPS